MNVLVACEESQRVCTAFRENGHNAFSCDILECSGGHPEWHIKGDVLSLINGRCSFVTQDGRKHEIKGRWDLIIAHPPCTYLTVTGNRWFDTGKYGKSAWDRMKERNKAISFFYRFVMADADRIAIENPIGIMSTAYRSPNQIIQPFMFGDSERKATCLWLKNLPELRATKYVEPNIIIYKNGKGTDSAWHMDSIGLSPEERAKVRSRTFLGVAAAMAEQWG